MGVRPIIPSNLRKPGTYAIFDTTSGAKGLTPINRLVALNGNQILSAAWAATTAYVVGDRVRASGNLYRATVAGTSSSTAPSHTSGTAVDGTVTWLYEQAQPIAVVATPYLMFSEADGEAYFGRGSELALMIRHAFRAANKARARGDGPPQIWAVASADPAGTRGTRTLTVTASSALSGDIVLRVDGFEIRVGVAVGEAQNTIASNIKSVLEGRTQDLPWTSSVATNVVTMRANQSGVNTNAGTVVVVSAPSGVTVTAAVGVTGTGSYDITAALDGIRDRRYNGVAIANHLAADITDLKAYADQQHDPALKYWVQTYLAETGTLTTATTLATGANDFRVNVISAEDFPSLPGEIAAQFAVTVESKGYAAANLDDTEFDLPLPQFPASLPTNTEIEVALAAGTTQLTANDEQDQAKVIRWVTTKTVENGAPFENLLDGSNPRAMYYGAVQIDISQRRVLHPAQGDPPPRDEQTRRLVESVTKNTLRDLEDARVYHNVEDHLDELVVELDPIVSGRINTQVPATVVPNLHQLAVRHVLIVE